eukprot:CAMPEP_0181480466 /NCGR_PEP_ID=MMETSP1110-20121109/43815_1 /TAXON_ID=174948 /ORGANISM="Symbiodinium sp., Strain CCMP421" /LENGTH=39 /DNA_ID= /DNA_START= /DNA_END= /DNA_ORIENTATION=
MVDIAPYSYGEVRLSVHEHPLPKHAPGLNNASDVQGDSK